MARWGHNEADFSPFSDTALIAYMDVLDSSLKEENKPTNQQTNKATSKKKNNSIKENRAKGPCTITQSGHNLLQVVSPALT
jgi:hypothetical protein